MASMVILNYIRIGILWNLVGIAKKAYDVIAIIDLFFSISFFLVIGRGGGGWGR